MIINTTNYNTIPLVLSSSIRTKSSYYNLPKYYLVRFMMSSRCIFAIRALYHGLDALTNTEVINQTTKYDRTTFAKNILNYSMQPLYGIPQHKEAIVTHITTQKVCIEDIFEPMRELYIPSLKYEPNLLIDPRIIKESYVFWKYYQEFHKDIIWMYATGDARPATFSHQKQSNQDLWVNVKTKNSYGDLIDNLIGLKHKVVPQDEKAGSGMFNHSTRGTIGLLSYDSQNNNIQMTSNPINSQDLVDYNLNRVRDVRAALINDNKDLNVYKNTFKEITDLFQKVNRKDLIQVLEIHKKAQHLLWENLQCDSSYNRSISFILIDQLKYNNPITNNEQFFHDRFISLLPNRSYNLDKKGDCQQVFRAMITAYRDTVDPLVVKKLYYLKGNAEIQFTSTFLETLSKLLQTGI